MFLRQWIGLGRLSVVDGLLLCALAGSPAETRAQDGPKTNPLIFYLDEDHTRYLKFGTWVQIWGQQTEMNPGSLLSQGGLVQDTATDVLIRRFRFSMDVQLVVADMFKRYPPM